MRARAVEVLPFVTFGEIAAAAADALRPPRKISVAECAEKHRRLDNPGGGYVGPWRNALAPWLVEPMDRCASRATSTVILIGPAQISGKTELLLNAIVHSAKYNPAPMLAFMPTQLLARDFSQRRVERGCFLASPDLRNELGEDRSDDTAFYKAFRNGASLTIAWPVPSQLASRPVAMALIDERDSMPDDIHGEGAPEALAEKRTRTFGRNAKTIIVSSPKRADYSGILPLYDQGDRSLWHWPCAECGEYFTPGFDAKRRPTLDQLYIPQGATPEIARREARLICPLCGALLEEIQKAAMNARGLWLPIGCSIDRSGTIIGARPEARVASYWFSGLAARALPWGDLAAEYVNALQKLEQHQDETALKTFWQTTLGAPYAPRVAIGDALDADALAARSEAGRLPRGVVPADAALLTSSVDVQGNRFVCKTVAWLPQGAAHVVDQWDVFKTEGADGLERQVDPANRREDWDLLFGEVIERAWPVEGQPEDAAGMRPLLTAIDAHGKKGTTGQAYDFWIRARMRNPEYRKRVLLVRGGNREAAPMISVAVLEVDNRGRKLKKGIKLATLNVSAIKDMLASRLRVAAGAPGYVTFARDLPRAYFLELTAEHKAAGAGWQKLPDRERNEAWDLFVYCMAAFIRLGGHRIIWPARATASDGVPAPAAAASPAPVAPSIATAPAPAMRASIIPQVARRRRGLRGSVEA